MPHQMMLAVEWLALRASSELEQLEGVHRRAWDSGDGDLMGCAVVMLSGHVAITLKHWQVSLVVTEAEQAALAGGVQLELIEEN